MLVISALLIFLLTKYSIYSCVFLLAFAFTKPSIIESTYVKAHPVQI